MTKSKKTLFRKISSFICMFVLVFSYLALVPTQSVKAATLNLVIDGVKTSYTGKQVLATCDGKNVNMKNTPGIVMNGTSYVSYKDVFGSSKLGASVSYNSKDKKITIKKYSNTLVMTVGSKAALVNGKKVTMPAAPMKVKFPYNNVTKILVPTEFVATTLGYSYSWKSDSTTVTVQINSGLVLTYDKKTSVYTGTKAGIRIDGNVVNLDALPGIIIDQTNLVQAKKVFTQKAIGADYDYNKETKEVTIDTEDIEIRMKIDSKVAYVNDKKKTMPTACRIIKNVTTGKSYVVVPAEFVATNLGFSYQWNSATKTGDISTKEELPTVTPTPTPSPTPIPTPENNQVVKTFDISNTYFDTYNRLVSTGEQNFSNVNTSNVTGAVNTIEQVQEDEVNYDEFTFTAVEPFSNITSSKNSNLLTIHADQMICNSQTYVMNSSFVSTIESKYDSTTTSSDFVFALKNENLSYEIIMSSDAKTMTVRIHTNYISQIELGTNSNGEYVTIHSLRPITPVVTETDDMVTLTMTQTMNSLDKIAYSTENFTSLTGVYTESYDSNGIQINLLRSADTTYTITSTENSYTITFPKKEVVTPPPADLPEKESDSPKPYKELSYTAVQIPVPSGFKVSKVSDQDLYAKKQIKLTLSGDLSDTVTSKTILKNSSYVSSVSTAIVNGNTVVTINTTRICGYKYIVKSGYLCVAIDRPNQIYDKIVLLDPGHGGTASGAVREGIKEKDLNFAMLYTRMKSLLTQYGVKAYYTRTEDVDVSLYTRPEISAEVDADIFVSLHCNSSTSTSPRGTEVYYSTKNSHTMNGLTSKKMAELFTKSVATAMEIQNRGAKDSPNLIVLKYNTVPSVLIETGFLSNASDREKLTDSYYQTRVAQAVAKTIGEILDTYPTGR